jgi:formyltetrahydrofolate-dependent phosphoribosylglycinamide formyltransferase
MNGRRRVAILISGRGSNMAALIAAARAPDYPAEIVRVIASRPDAGGIARAQDAGVKTAVVAAKSFADRAAFEAEITRQVEQDAVDIVCLAGFMRVLSPAFVERWRGRLINIHPSLLPAFPGLDTHARAIAAGASEHGCTVHFVSEGVDEGPIISQARVPVLPGDTPEALAERVLNEEHKLYPAALAMVATGKARQP